MQKQNIVFNQTSLQLELRDTAETSDTAVCILSFDEVFDELPGIIKTEAAAALIQKLVLKSHEKIAEQGILQDGKHTPIQIRVTKEKRLICTDELRKVLLSDFSILGLSTRTYNCFAYMKRIKVFEPLIFKPEDLMQFRNFGVKSFTEFEKAYQSHNITDDIIEQIQNRLLQLELTALRDVPELLNRNEIREFLDRTEDIKDLSLRKLGDYYQLSGRSNNSRFKELNPEMFPRRGGSFPDRSPLNAFEKRADAEAIHRLLTQTEDIVKEYLQEQLFKFVEG